MEQKNFNYILLVAIIAFGGITIGMQSMIIINMPGLEYPVTVRIAGSTTCYPVIADAGPQFMAIHPNYDIQLAAGGSGTGESRLASGTIDIAMMSKACNSAHLAEGWVDHVFALDGVSVIVNKATLGSATWITMDAIFKIYNQTYINWDDLSTTDWNGPTSTGQPIVVYIRESGSGTLDCFESTVKYNATTALKDATGYKTATFSQVNGNPQMASAVSTTDYSIGFCGMAFVETTHDLLDVNATNSAKTGYLPASIASTETVQDKSYPISRELHLYTDGAPNSVLKTFLNYVLGWTGQALVEDNGYVIIPRYANGTASYVPNNPSAILDPYTT